MKFLEFLKKTFTQHIPLKLLAIVLAVFCAIVIGAASNIKASAEPAAEESAVVEFVE